MTDRVIIAGDVVQLCPGHRWAGSFWIVEKVREWGVQAYCTIPGSAGVSYIRLAWGEFERVGAAPHVLSAPDELH